MVGNVATILHNFLKSAVRKLCHNLFDVCPHKYFLKGGVKHKYCSVCVDIQYLLSGLVQDGVLCVCSC